MTPSHRVMPVDKSARIRVKQLIVLETIRGSNPTADSSNHTIVAHLSLMRRLL
jgi:hypothetical protein